ncbi:hypothetical protein HHI36_008480 [Cryptolaemus montrouzieri]|uniref:Protein BCCIP homolog n=1 Tax=Cryptolaemus montrouzieri TaxID=559131 RepID=A0ABD2MSM2_9CUCU
MGSKKRKLQNNSDNDIEDEASDVSIENENNEIQATFEGRNLEDFDFHGIKQLLQQAFLKAHVDLTQVTDMLINQQGLGSVLKQVSEDESEDAEDDSNEVFGVTTVLNMTAHRETPCVRQLLDFFKVQAKKYGNTETQQKVNEILDENKKIGLLINERFLNIPAAISVPMLSSLQEEIKRMRKKNQSYEFQNFIMVCKTYRPKKDKSETSFSNDEECIFSANADYNFEYSVAKEADTAIAGKWGNKEEEVIPFRKVLIFSANKLESIISQIKNFVQT